MSWSVSINIFSTSYNQYARNDERVVIPNECEESKRVFNSKHEMPSSNGTNS